MKKQWLMALPIAGAVAVGVTVAVGTDNLLGAADAVVKQDVKPAVTLPITRVVLFNSGVGYFSRSGEVVDDARVDLTFPEQDINDLLKSMVLEDSTTDESLPFLTTAANLSPGLSLPSPSI